MSDSSHAPLLVACLCAQWCGSCREYQPLFMQLHQQFPHTQWMWVDVEDLADVVDPIEVENFPTLLIADAQSPRFFGTLPPHIETLQRLVQAHAQGDTPAQTTTADQQALAQRLWQRCT
jgi:thioredoxin 1